MLVLASSMMKLRGWLLIAILAACGPGPAPSTPAPARGLAGAWADPMHTAVLHADHEAELELRRQCARLPCASGTTRLGTWTPDPPALVVGGRDDTTRYRLRLDEDGAVLVLAPPTGDDLRLRRQPALVLAGTAWEAPDRTLTFTADGFARTAPCASCEDPVERIVGTWTFAGAQLDLVYEGANESFAVLVEAGGAELVLIDATETVRYRRR